MVLISLCIVGKSNEPLFLREFSDDYSNREDILEAELFGLTVSDRGVTDGFSSKAKNCSLKQQFVLHAALDRFEELAGPPPGFAWRESGSTGTNAMWVGLLCPMEDMRVYGYQTTTQMKIMAVVEDSITSQQLQNQLLEEEVKQLLVCRYFRNLDCIAAASTSILPSCISQFSSNFFVVYYRSKFIALWLSTPSTRSIRLVMPRYLRNGLIRV